MTDPLSITASIVSITIPALHGARLLLDDLQKINDALETVERLKDDVHSVDMAFLASNCEGSRVGVAWWNCS
jgi:hypothetical protein